MAPALSRNMAVPQQPGGAIWRRPARNATSLEYPGNPALTETVPLIAAPLDRRRRTILEAIGKYDHSATPRERGCPPARMHRKNACRSSVPFTSKLPR